MKVIAWKAWYAGGAAFCSSSGIGWEDLPDDGMLGYVLIFEKDQDSARSPRRLSTGADWYWKAPGPIYGHSNDTREDILKRYPNAILIRGKWTTEEDHSRALHEMYEWEPE